MTKFLGKGIKGSLQKIYITNDQNQIIKILTIRNEIEQGIINHNHIYLKQAHITMIYRDRIYQKLKNNDTRDKILSGALE